LCDVVHDNFAPASTLYDKDHLLINPFRADLVAIIFDFATTVKVFF